MSCCCWACSCSRENLPQPSPPLELGVADKKCACWNRFICSSNCFLPASAKASSDFWREAKMASISNVRSVFFVSQSSSLRRDRSSITPQRDPRFPDDECFLYCVARDRRGGSQEKRVEIVTSRKHTPSLTCGNEAASCCCCCCCCCCWTSACRCCCCCSACLRRSSSSRSLSRSLLLFSDRSSLT